MKVFSLTWAPVPSGCSSSSSLSDAPRWPENTESLTLNLQEQLSLFSLSLQSEELQVTFTPPWGAISCLLPSWWAQEGICIRNADLRHHTHALFTASHCDHWKSVCLFYYLFMHFYGWNSLWHVLVIVHMQRQTSKNLNCALRPDFLKRKLV